MISLGSSCAVANYLKERNIRHNSYPFDWCKININQLNKVLAMRFHNFHDIKIVKYSDNHPYLENYSIENNSIENNSIGSFVLKNDYNIIFAHEIINKYDIDNFKERLLERINRFTLLESPTFIKYEEPGKMKTTYIQNLIELLMNLSSYFKEFKLILVVPENYNIMMELDNLRIIKYKVSEEYTWQNIVAFNDIYFIDVQSHLA
jgi:hypothetical protein